MNQVTQPAPGDTIADRYRIERLLGAGAFARVFLGRHERISSMLCAIKILHGDRARERESVRRFIREAETAAALQSRHVVRVTDFGETEAGSPFLVMDLVRGQALDDVLKRVNRLNPWQTAHVARGVLKALHEAHAIGIVHRDLKPGNILLHLDGSERHAVPRVADFGIAKVLRDVESPVEAESMTMGDIVLCTPQYAAPELLGGSPVPQTDIYALGHSMYEMLMGQVPYAKGNHIQIASRHLAPDPLTLPPDFPSESLGRIILKASAKELTARYATAAEMLVDIEAWMANEPPERDQEPISVEIPPEIPWTGPIAARSRDDVPRADATNESSQPSAQEQATRAVTPPSGETSDLGDGVSGGDSTAGNATPGSSPTRASSGDESQPGSSPGTSNSSATTASSSAVELRQKLMIGVALAGIIVVVGVVLMAALSGSDTDTESDTPEEVATPVSIPEPLGVAVEAVESAVTSTSEVLVLDADIPGVEVRLGDDLLGSTPLNERALPTERPLELELRAPDGDSMTVRVVSPGPFVFSATFGGPIIAHDAETVPSPDETSAPNESDRGSSSTGRSSGPVRNLGRGIGNAFQRRILE